MPGTHTQPRPWCEADSCPLMVYLRPLCRGLWSKGSMHLATAGDLQEREKRLLSPRLSVVSSSLAFPLSPFLSMSLSLSLPVSLSLCPSLPLSLFFPLSLSSCLRLSLPPSLALPPSLSLSFPLSLSLSFSLTLKVEAPLSMGCLWPSDTMFRVAAM